MRKRLRKSIAGILALLMVVGSFQLNGLQVKAEEPTTEDLTYTMEQMEQYAVPSEVTMNDGSDGKQLSFPGNYKTIFWAVPAELGDAEITQIKFNVGNISSEQVTGAGVGMFAFKMLTEAGYNDEELKWKEGVGTGMYGNPTRVVPDDLDAPIKYVAITSVISQDDKDARTINMEISGITFTVKKDASPEGSEPQITAKVTTTEVDKTYSLGSLKKKNEYAVTSTPNEASGSMKLDYAATQGAEVTYEIPEDIDFSKVKKIAITLKSGDVTSLGIKTYTQAAWDDANTYQTDVEYGKGYLVPTTDLADVKYIGISSLAEGTNSVVVESITFTVEGSVTYPMSLLTEANVYGVTVTENNGSEKLDFAGENNEIAYEVPADVNIANVKKISYKITDGTKEKLAVKTYTKAAFDDPNIYQTEAVYWQDFIEPTKEVKDVEYIALTNNGTEAKSITVESVTFTYTEASSVGVNPDAEEGGSGDNPTGGDSGNTGNTPGDGDNGGTQPETTTEVTYNFKDLENVNFYGVLLNVGKGGELSADYEKQYQETFYKLPDNIDSTKVKKVELVLSSGNSLCLKLYPNADGTGNSEFANDYGPVVVPTKEFSSFGIMNMVDGTNAVKVSGVKFTIADSVENVEIKKTYSLMDLYADKKNEEVTSVENGDSVELTYAGQYKEIFFEIPKEIDSAKVHKVTFSVTSGNGDKLDYKFYTENDFGGDWPTAHEEQQSWQDPVAEIPSGFNGMKYFGVMSTETGNTVVTIDSVTFHTTGWGYSDVVKEPTVAGDKVFLADDVSVSWGSANYDEQVEGKIDVQFKKEGQGYPEVRIYLGEELNMADCTSVKFVVADQTAPVAFKLWQGASEKKVWYGNSGKQEYVFTPGIADSIDSIGIMYADTAENVPDDASISFISVTFTMKEGSSSNEDEYYETDDTQGDNLITNPNFADADLSMWGVAQDGSTITTGVSETPIFADVKTYGIISDRTSNYQAFAQDLTGKVQNNKEYSFSFFAKLSDDYADAPSSQRQITFGPYEVTDGNANYNIQVSGSPKTLTAGKWTKITGTFKMASLGDPDQVVVRLLEQGENYGSGPGVKGEYYITGVSVKEIVKEKVEIEKDIPDWQSAIVKDLGAGTIAGTAVTYNEMADEALWELVTKHFNAVTFGNELKLDAMIGGAKGETEHITFNGKDLEVPVLKLEEKQATQMLNKILEWNTANPDKKLKVRGHVLVWHSQAPAWFFKENYDANADYVSKDVMDLRLEWYIKTILEYYTGANSKYKDLFYGWDVVNEAINDSTATYRGADESSWAAVYGDKSNEYIIKAFQWANKYAPASLELYYNDYNDCVPSKVAGIVELLKAVKAAEGTRIDGMGMQAHHNIDSPSVEQVEAAVRAYCAVVGKVQWTELDIKASSAYDGTDATRAEEWNKMAHRYKAYYDVLKKLDAEDGIEVSAIIFWGVVDKYSWLQTSNSVGGASNGGNQCPLLFDDNYKAKPAFWAFVDPDRLTPDVKNIVIAQKVDNTYPSGVEYSMEKGATKATVIPMWDTTGLKVLVKVQDATVDATDAVTVYVDPAMTGGATTPVKATVKRADAKAVSGGYEAEVAVALSSVGALKEVSMDVVVVNGTEKVAFNDTTFAQESSSKYYANALMKVGTTVQNGTIVVDGVVDAEWAEADVIPLAIGSVKAKPTFKVLWDKEYLYVLAEVQDSVLNKDNKDAWMQDSIEVFIDENNKKSSGYDGDDKQYRINYANEASYNGQKCIAENVKSAAKVVDGGYVIEAAFKWTDIKPANGTNVGLELQLNDAESSTVRNKLSWADDTDKGWESSRVFGTITLVGDPTLPELVEDLEVLVDKNATKEEKIEAVKEVIAKVQEVVEAGNTEELTNELVAEIEDLFAESIGRVLEIVNKDNKVPQIKKVIGAIIGINLEDEAKMVFEAGTAPALDAKYKNAFAFDAKLFAGNKAIQPLVPVTIRMEVPSSIDKNGKIAVLHYKDGATTPEKLAAKIVDGLLEFTTSSFSTFVVVNEVEEQSSGGNTGSAPGETAGSNSGSSAPAATPAPSTDTGVKAPATGDSAYPIAVVAILLLTGSAAVIMAKKRKKEEE